MTRSATTLRAGTTLKAGLAAGLIGYGAVAVFYAVFDVLGARRPLFTLDMLGRVVFRGARDPAILQLPIVPDMGAMFAYNLLHLVTALVVGLFVAWLVARVYDRRTAPHAALTILLAGYVVTIFIVASLGRDALPLLPWWTIVFANTLAALLAGAYLLRAHPGLWGRLTEAP